MPLNFRDVKSAQGDGTSLALPAFVVNPIVGDYIVVLQVSWKAGGGTTHTAPTDSAGNTYTRIGTMLLSSTNHGLSKWRTLVTTGGASFVVTVNPVATATNGGIAMLLNGNSGDPYNGDTVGQIATAANPTSGVSSPTPSADSMFIGEMNNGSVDPVTNGAGWNATGVNGFTTAMDTACRLTDNVTFQDLFGEYLIASIATAAVWTCLSDAYAARVASFLSTVIVPDIVGKAKGCQAYS